jgi:hypothetical protein
MMVLASLAGLMQVVVDNLVVLETPLQLLNAFEAARIYRGNTRLVVLVSAALPERRFKSLIEALPYCPWKEIRYVRLKYINLASRYRRRLAYRVKLRLTLPFGNSPKTVLIGNYLNNHKPYFRHVANLYPNSEVVLLDDGTDTVTVASERLAYHHLSVNHPTSLSDGAGLNRTVRRGMLGRLTHKMGDWNDTPRKAVTFFTAYDIQVKAPDTCVKHHYESVVSLRKIQSSTDELWILGQCLPEDGYISREDYAASVKDLRFRLPADKVIYIPHPRESGQTISLIESIPGIEIRKFSLPIEFALLRSPSLPAAVASFYCTALINLSLVFGASISSYAYVLDSSVIRSRAEEIAEIYDAIKKMKIPHMQFLTSPVT